MSREMKNSGVKWIGKTPADWANKKFKHCFSIISGNGFPVELQGRTDEKYPFAKAGTISSSNIFLDSAKDSVSQRDVSILKFNIIPIGSIVFPKIGEALRKNSRAITRKECCIDNNCQAVFPKNIDLYFAYYLLTIMDMRWYDNGGTIPSINNFALRNDLIPYPSLAEQRQIVSFLDRKCSAIDTAIEKTKKSIEKLEEYKKAVITKAVTKGLDPDAKMKDSGVEWIGEVPETWDTLRIKHSSWLKGRIGWDGLKSEEFIDDGPYLITGTDFNDGIVNWDTCVHITEDRYNEDKLLHVYNGDLLITKDGTVGKLAIITNAPDKVSLNSGVMIIRNNSKFKYDQQYMFYVLKSDVFTKWFDHHKKPGSTIQHLYQHQFDDFRYPFPSLAEQKNIAAYLEEKCKSIDTLISKKVETISKWEEYKKSLIYYAVTGKIDCRNEVV